MVGHHGAEDNTLGPDDCKAYGLGPVANTDTKLLIYGLFQKGRVLAQDAVRNEHYKILREGSLTDLKLDALRHLGIHGALDLVEVEERAQAIGESPTSLNLRRVTGAIVIAVVRAGKALYRPDATFGFRPGDTVVLVGDREALEAAAKLFKAAAEG